MSAGGADPLEPQDPAARYARVAEAFSRARELVRGDRGAFLASLAEDERREVEELLVASGAPEDALSDRRIEGRRGRVPWGAGSAGPEDCPERIGPFRVLRCLGRGGMGVVYEAEQEIPRRRVAIKLVQPGVAFGERLRRFRLEAEALGRLKHPGIAQIFEFGTCDLGQGEQPYFVMELVEGQPLLVHAREAQLDRRARLALVAELCDAVQHAHERGVVHRDLKPDNVLVDGAGRPKVLDFGVARVRADDVSLTTIHTAQGQIVGTLTHMAPEQLAGNPDAVGPAADVYALGVIAFELLSGRLPHEVAGLSLTQAARRITEVEAPLLGTLERGLRGDLETIVAKALEPDPTRRYVTPAALAADLRRFLASEPIAARPAGKLYRARKFTRRHPGLVGGTSAAFLALSVGLALAWNFALDARAGRRVAEGASYRHVLKSVAATLNESPTDIERALLLEAPESLRSWEWEYLRTRTADPSVPCVEGAVRCFVIAAVDGAMLLATYTLESRLLEVRDLGDDRTVFSRELTQGHPSSLALTASGDMTWIEGGPHAPYRARRIRLSGGEETLDRPLEMANDFAPYLSSDGRRVVGVQRIDGSTSAGFLIDLDTGQVSERSSTVMEPDRSGDLLLHQVHDGALYLVEVAGGDELLRLPRAVGSFDQASGRLVTMSESLSFRLQVWDTDTRPVRELFATTTDADPRCVSIAPKDRAIAVVDQSGTLTTYVLDGLGGLPVPRVLGKPGSDARPCWWPDGTRLALSTSSGIRTWDADLPADEVLTTHASFAYDLAADPALGLLASAGWDGRVGQPGCLRLFDLDSGAEVLRTGGEQEVALWASWLPGTQRLLVSFFAASRVRCLDVVRGQILWEQDMGRLNALACSPDGRSVAVALDFGDLCLLDAADGREQWRWNSTKDDTVCEKALAWSPDGALLAISDATIGSGRTQEHRIVLLDALTGREVRSVGLRPLDRCEHFLALAFSPDGLLLAGASDDYTVHLWNPGTGQYVRPPLEHDAPVLAVAFHPDGRRLATGARDGVVRIWNLETGEELLRVSGHEGYVRTLLWTDAGRTLLSASGDGTVRRWSTRTARELGRARKEHARLMDALRPRVEAFLAGKPPPEAIDAWLKTCADTPREREVARQLVMQSWPSSDAVPAPR